MTERTLTSRRRRASALLIAGAVAIAGAMIAVFVGFLSAEDSFNDAGRAAAASRERARAAFEVLEAVANAETGHRGYVATSNLEFRAMFVNNQAESWRAIALLQSTTRGDPLLEPAAARVVEAARRRLDYCGRAVALTDSGRHDQAIGMILSPRAGETSSQVRATIFSLVDAADSQAISFSEHAAERDLQMDRLALAMMMLALVACSVTGWAVLQERRSWQDMHAVLARANADLEAARQRAVESDSAKGRFLATASHDLRQPLHAISLYLGALRRRVTTPDTQAILANMDRATQSMIGMFSALLDLARIQSGVHQPLFETVALAESFARVRAEFDDADIEVEPTELCIRSDPRLLESMLRNFVSNALKHGDGWARIEAAQTLGGVTIRVLDRGPGIPPDKRDEIFHEFTRLPGTRTEGLGLGLAIAKGLADQLGLRIIIEPRAEGGTCFAVVAPEAQPGAQADPAEAELPPFALRDVPVIVVDDEALVREATAETLRDAGAIVQTAASVEELDTLIDQGAKPRVLVMDYRLDGELRGLEAATAARARIEPTPAVIMVTGDTAPETLTKLHESGFVAVNKPVNPYRLIGITAIAAELTHGTLRGPPRQDESDENAARGGR